MITRIRLKEPLAVKRKAPHPIKEVERVFGGGWACETLRREALKEYRKSTGLKAHACEFVITEFHRCY